ncbi:MAG: peptidylprolyl isomerase, partial [Sedimentisphaerales bacterium]|nr:peptidylprolyl isomerase [Sedimentisphaerales bacterium]
MQKMFLLMLALAGICSFAIVHAQESTAPAAPEVKVVAQADPAAPAVKVNGVVINEGMIEQAIGQQLANRSKAPQNPELIERYKKIMRPRVIDNLINMELIGQAAKKDGLALTDADIDARLEDLVKLAMEQSKMTRDELAQDILKRQGVTIEESLASYRNNKQFLETILLEKVAAARFAQQIEVSDQDIQSYYDENKAARYTKQEMVKASHILVKTIDEEGQPVAEEQKAQALAKIKEIKARVDSEGSDFAALAGEFSDCPSGKRSGGDLGFFARTGAMVEPFASKAFALKPGEVSDIVETKFG